MLRFGTHALVGSVADMQSAELATYIAVFLNTVGHKGSLLLAHDHREVSKTISAHVAGVAEDLGLQIIYAGALPAPALAFAATRQRAPGVMVTSPSQDETRSSIRFFTPNGELSRYDEARISAAVDLAPPVMVRQADLPAPSSQPITDYIIRFSVFQSGYPLRGRKIGLLRNGSTAAYALQKVFSLLGATVDFLGDPDASLPLDLSDLDHVTLARCRKWLKEEGLSAIVSTSPAGDHPFLMDDQGTLVPGDVLAPICAAELGARTVIAAGTASSLVESIGGFERITRSETAFPDVHEAVQHALSRGRQNVVGYDTSGGVILGFDSMRGKQVLSRMICRDGALPLVAAFVHAAKAGLPISTMMRELNAPNKSTVRLESTPWPVAARIIRALVADHARLELPALGAIVRKDQVAGLRLTYQNGAVLHIEPKASRAELLVHFETHSSTDLDSLRNAAMTLLSPADQAQGRRA